MFLASSPILWDHFIGNPSGLDPGDGEISEAQQRVNGGVEQGLSV